MFSLASAQTVNTVDVGSGAPNTAITSAYQQAFYRNGFLNLVSLPPLGKSRRSEPPASSRNSPMPAKATSVPITENGGTVFQVYGGLYAYYTTLGVGNVGFPASAHSPPTRLG